MLQLITSTSNLVSPFVFSTPEHPFKPQTHFFEPQTRYVSVYNSPQTLCHHITFSFLGKSTHLQNKNKNKKEEEEEAEEI